MKKYIKNIRNIALGATALFATTACVGDLDVSPIDPNLNTKEKIKAEQLFTKCYGYMAMAGIGDGDGDVDVANLDGGTQGFVRQLFNANELTTDEAICAWNDTGIPEFNYNSYSDSHPMLNGFYYRLYFGVTVCNQYLREFGNYDATMSAEVRFVRALAYYYLTDNWGNIPFTLEVSAVKPPQYSRAQMYEWLEKEVKEIEPLLSEAKAKTSADAGYGRVDKSAAWLLLARLYANAEVYTGTPQWAKAAEYAKKVINSPHKLYTGATKRKFTAYQQLFMGDNGENGSSVEAILPILSGTSNQYTTINGQKTYTWSWGSSLFLMASTFNKDMNADPNGQSTFNGTDQTWGGNRARIELVQKWFPNNDAPSAKQYDMAVAAGDDRCLLYSEGRNLKIENEQQVKDFTYGYSVAKFTNFRTDGQAPSHVTYPDADFFLMRSAEAYLLYAEATARLNGNRATTEGVGYINQLRARAHATAKAGYTLNDILDEWSREFYFEGLRRTTLIRFNKFGGNSDYVWSWKGGVAAGRNFAATRNIFAIPNNDIIQNTNLKQNPGY
ncbi:MAG: RagB/SusD family nutrient uptake outer membrane protein [Prevotella sp.]|nr:RagB/SusD family nutrient uptake outer membrane protein [Prevotella sp.]MDD7273979.1 RagB/SusD family nutrient uptake outer membrane protein [Prevotellaceae bacterium]MDY3936214.1 RagB/SusD family nutrient uptake outer membrane protein [Prevotella sp.]MDY4218101.1 RagB/SusD family nutrient uptake outer membrane protein [Prevotella sp.]